MRGRAPLRAGGSARSGAFAPHSCCNRAPNLAQPSRLGQGWKGMSRPPWEEVTEDALGEKSEPTLTLWCRSLANQILDVQPDP